ncbi:MAG: transglycosylase SLT domain-containing protein [Bdellovibrionota bacterium]
MRYLPLLLLAPGFAQAALPAPLEDFLGAPPARFEQRFHQPAKQLKAARKLELAKNYGAAIAKLSPLANGEMSEHALFELATLYREKKDFAKSVTSAERLQHSFPSSVYGDRVRELIDQDECDQGLIAKRDEAIHLLERCLWRAPWKTWGELEPQATALYNYLKESKDPLLDPFSAEVIQAMPAGSALRKTIAHEVPAEKLEKLATLARFRAKNPNAAGVKPQYPDADLFDSGIKAVLKDDWKEANSIFKRFPSEFPQSEHWDRAQYWIARTEAKLGHEDEAKKRFTQILAENPFTYYGLQAAIYLKHDWLPQINDPAPPFAAKWEGSLTTRQALSLWRLRALLLEGLVDYAREEAKTLGGSKANGAGVGQEDPKGALLMARLFGESGNYMAAFSHAYAALSLDPALVNRDSVSLIFPQPFLEDFITAADRTGVNSLLLLSVAKQESAFLPNALSHADACGLMQLLPVTAREVLPGTSRGELYDPAVNTQAGGLYLYKLLDKYQGNIALALAAYNAGPNRVSQWQRDLLADSSLMKSGFDPDAFIDAIPFSETRKYVGNILRNYAWYKMLAKDGTVSSIQELMFQWQKSPKKPAEVLTPPAPKLEPEKPTPENPQ